jgi:hypothetical protein
MEVIPALRSVLSRKDFDDKFKPAFRELGYLRRMAFQQKGFWIFKSHVFGVTELLDSPHFSKIDSIVEKIGDDVNHWLKHDQLSFFDKQFYWENKTILDDEVHQLKIEIIERQPTWWESFHDAFDEFFSLMMNKLPELSFPFLPVQVTNLVWKALSNKNTAKKLLPSYRLD